MPPLLQVALGLLPVSLGVILCLALKKLRPARAIPLLAVLLAAAGLCACFALKEDADGQSTSAAPPLPAEDGLRMVYAAADEDNLDLAAALLSDLRSSGGDTPEHSLCAARLRALAGDWRAAAVLYERAGEDGEERELALLAAETRAADPVLASYLGKSSSDDGDWREHRTDAELAVADAVEQAAEGEDDAPFPAAARYISRADALYGAFLSGAPTDMEESEKLERKLDRLCEETPALTGVRQVRLARLKLQVLGGDYKALAGSVNAQADYDELLVASELYLNGYVKKSAFADDYGAQYAQQCTVVAGQLQRVYDRFYADEDRAVRNQVNRYLDELSYMERNPALAQMSRDMLDAAQSGPVEDRTKLYLQLSKIANRMGNETAASRYLSASLDTVGDCADDSFTQPMYEIIGIIADKDDPARLRDVAGYVDRVLENSATIRLPETLTAPAPPEEGEEDKSPPEDYRAYLTDTAIQTQAAINILDVDPSGFEQVTATISVDSERAYSAEELQSLLSVRDCGADIGAFTVEKVAYDAANVLLCCDVSGSMEGKPITDLRTAVEGLVSGMSDREQVALVLFSSQVDASYPFTSDPDDLLPAVSAIRAGGGTNMYDAMLQSMDLFRQEEGALNVAVLLSDGEDNNSRSAEDIYNEVGGAAMAKGVTIYSLGLGGSADADYLSAFASATGGNFLYVNDSATLDSFYRYLNGLMFNQYRITFRAEDTLSVSRELRVSLAGNNLTYDLARYLLPGAEEGAESGDVLADRAVYGLDTRLILKGTASTVVHLKGKGFEKDESVSVAIKDNLEYELKAEFVDGGTYRLTIPAGVACGSYDLHVTLGGRKAVLDRELVVATPGSEKTVAFGPYVFTAYSSATDGDAVTLSGYVSMNGFLFFRGDVTLAGALDGPTAILSDLDGSYIQYDKDIGTGLAKHLAQRNVALPLPALGQVELFQDKAHPAGDDEYPVREVPIPLLYLTDVCTFKTPGLALYPDRVVLDFQAFSTALPFQDKLLSTVVEDVFSFEVAESQLVLTAKNIGLKLEVGGENEAEDKDRAYRPVDLLGMRMKFSPAEFNLKLNTVDNEYEVMFKTRLDFLPMKGVDGVGLGLSWSGALLPSAVRFYADADLTSTIGGVPITFSDFEAAVTDIDMDDLRGITLEGKASASAYKISALLKGLDEWLGDVSLCSFKDATLRITPAQFSASFSTDFYLLEELKLAGIEIAAGKMSYSNRLLNMDEEEVAGLRAKLTVGPELETDNCNLRVQGSGELALTNKVLGLTASGTCEVDVRWWVLTSKISESGDLFIGGYVPHNPNSTDMVFALRAETGRGNGFALVWDKDTYILPEVTLT